MIGFVLCLFGKHKFKTTKIDGKSDDDKFYWIITEVCDRCGDKNIIDFNDKKNKFPKDI